jgi:hypothetical protein
MDASRVVKTPQVSIIQKIFKYLFYLSVVAFVLFIFLLILHFTGIKIFTFGVMDSGGVLSIPTPQPQQVAFKTTPITPDLSCNFVDIYSTNYTISMDIYNKGDFYTTMIPRVLLYRSNTPIVLDPATTKVTNLASIFPSSNLIVYMDPMINDLYIGVKNTTGVMTTHKVVENTRLRDPFRICIVFSNNYVEVYVKGKLETMIPLSVNPMTTTGEAYFFGPPSVVNQNLKVANIMYYPYALSAKNIHSVGSAVSAKTIFG